MVVWADIWATSGGEIALTNIAGRRPHPPDPTGQGPSAFVLFSLPSLLLSSGLVFIFHLLSSWLVVSRICIPCSDEFLSPYFFFFFSPGAVDRKWNGSEELISEAVVYILN